MGSLGIGQVVRQRILVPRSGVRIPHPQPDATAEFKTYVPYSAFASAKREILKKRAVNSALFV